MMKRLLSVVSVAALLVTILASAAAANCTIGFWKNHPSLWFIDSMFLGEVEYDQQELLSILDEPVEGNGLVSLAHQLIGAKLNVAAGSVSTPEIDEADALIGKLIVPPIGDGFLDPSETSALVDALTEFNEVLGDEYGFGDCAPIAIDPLAWGRVKAQYR